MLLDTTDLVCEYICKIQSNSTLSRLLFSAVWKRPRWWAVGQLPLINNYYMQSLNNVERDLKMLKRSINLYGMLVPIHRCIRVSLGRVKRDDVDELVRRRFDQAPVLENGEKVLGTIDVNELRRLLDIYEPLSAKNQAIDTIKIPMQINLSDLLNALTGRQAVIVTSLSGKAAGLLAVSDLNSPRLRAFLYPGLIELETHLAKICRPLGLDRLSQDTESDIM
jgi:hypothetical protein